MKYTLSIILFSLITVGYFFYSDSLQTLDAQAEAISDQSIGPSTKIFMLNQMDYKNKKESTEKVIIAESESHDQLNPYTSISDAELLGLARVAVHGDDTALKSEAFDVLINLSPHESVVILNTLVLEDKFDPYIAQIVITGMLRFQSEKELLTNDNIKNLYKLDNPAIKKLAAQILSDRGDDSLTDRYIESFDSRSSIENSEVRLQTLFEASSLKKFNALPTIKTSLKDSDSAIRLQALNLLGTYGSDVDITDVEPLLNDTNPQVRAQSQLVMNNLWHKNTPGIFTQEQEFAAPVDGIEN